MNRPDGATSTHDRIDVPDDPQTRRLLAALLGLPSGAAAHVRAKAARARPRPQTGPLADLGD